MITKKYIISGMHCVSCSMMIEGELEDIGVDAQADYKKKSLQATFDEKTIGEEKIFFVVRSLGYDLAPDEP